MNAVEKLPPLEQLRRSLPDLPERLREAGQFIAEHEFDAATRSMRDLAASAGLQPATFTRLAQAIGHAGWDEFRLELVEAHRPEAPGPFSGRTGRRSTASASLDDRERLIAEIARADADTVSGISAGPIASASEEVHAARRIWIAGFRSCRSVATLLHYQLRLFREDVHLVGAAWPEDVDLGAFAAGDLVVVIGLAPYSRASLLAAREARRARATLIVIADRALAPIAEGAEHCLVFEPGATPAFFHSLTGAIAIAQALAAGAFDLGGKASETQLRRTEARLSAMSQYVSDEVSR